MEKLITYVTALTNDNYYEDLIYRVQKALDLNLFFLDKIKDKNRIEIIFVDWGSEKKLSDLIYVNSKFKRQIKFIYVNKKITKKHSKNYRNNFNLDTSFNVGIRRAKGKFVIVGGCDQFFDLSSWKNLINFAKENNGDRDFYLMPRKILDYDLYKSNFNNNYYLKSLDHFNSTNFEFKTHTFYSGGGFASMLSRSNFFVLRGLNEKMKSGVSNDTESILRSNLYGLNKVNTEKFGIYLYKFPPLKNSLRNKILKTKGLRLMPIPMKKITYNDLNWGLKNERLKISYSKNIARNFENSNKFFKDDIFENKEVNIYNTLLSSNQLHLKNIFYLRKIFIVIKLISFLKVSKFSEYGFFNTSILDIIGNRFRYLDIIIFDDDTKNYSQSYFDRIGRVIENYNKNRYGLFQSIIAGSDKFFFDYLKKNSVKGDSSFLLITPNDINSFNNSLRNSNIYKYKKLINYILIYKFNSYNYRNSIKYLKKNYNIYPINKEDIFLVKKEVLKKNNINEGKISALTNISLIEFIFPYFIYLCHRILSKTFRFIRALVYSAIR